jgi:signal transduction histidine kinase/DNA-binding response OmpR family regulator/HPt (histidine-containing phosphotransfer) domain-containing protein
MTKTQHKQKSRAVFLFITLSLFSLIVSGLLYSHYKNNLHDSSLNDLETISDRNISVLSHEIDQLGFVLFDIKLGIIRHHLLAPPQPLNRKKVEDFLLGYTAKNSLISQIRWIDVKGMERVRLDRVTRAGSKFTSAEVLQDKSSRYYVSEANSAATDTIYISPIDLNIEQGRVVQPFQPTLRMVIPTRNEEGLKDGIIVLNIDLTTIFEKIYASTREGMVFRVVDSLGSLIIDTDSPDEAWASLLGMSASAQVVRDTHLKRLITRADANIAGKYVGPDETLERLSGLLNSGQRTYYIHTYLSDNFLKGISREALIWRLPVLLLLLLFSAGVAVYVYTYDRRLQNLNAKLQLQIEEVEKVNLYKSTFLANMSHEIRTPLTSIIGLLDIIRRNPDGEGLNRNLALVSNAARNLLVLINDILDLTRIESGHLHLEIGELQIDALVDHSVGLFASEAETKKLELISEVDPELSSLSFTGDALRIQQLLNNLIGNGVKFTAKGGVNIRVELCEISDNIATVRFCVSDTGIGIDAAELDRLCEPFVQSDVSVTRRYGGSGLGLSITKHLLDLMTSQLQVKSQLDAGSSFSFVLKLPVAAERNAEVGKLRQEVPKKILIVDENPRICEVLDKMFSYWGCQTTALHSSDEAYNAVVEGADGGEPFGLLIVDKHLSKLEGVELIERINSCLDAKGHARPPEILMALEADRQSIAGIPELEGVSVLQKPVTMSRLLEALGGQNVISVVGGEAEPDVVAMLIASLAVKLKSARPPRILLADDNSYNRVLLELLFGSFGLTVVLVNDGLEALNKVLEGGFDLVFLDIQMPVMDGLTATRRIRSHFSAEALPVFAVSAATFESDIDAAKAAGFNAHIAKPINVENLLSLILQYWVPIANSPLIENSSTSKTNENNDAISSLFELAEFDSENAIYQQIGPSGYRRVATAFVKDMESELARFSSATTMSSEEQQRFLHRLKGAAASVGATTLAKLNAELSQRIAEEPNTSIAPLFEAIDHTIKILRRYLDIIGEET